MRVLALTLLLATATASAQTWHPTEADIADLEANALARKVARQHHDLAEYERYYAGEIQDGEKVILIQATLASELHRTPGVHIVSSDEDFPLTPNVGCTVMHFTYSMKDHRIFIEFCNEKPDAH